MATIHQYLAPEEAQYRTAAGMAQFVVNQGASFPVSGLAFDGAGTTPEYAFWKFSPFGYAGGDLDVTVRWYAASGTSGTVDFGAAVVAITPNTDSGDVESTAFDSSPVETDTHLGGTARRLHEVTIALWEEDTLMAAGDECWLRLSRNPATDSLSADAIVTSVLLSYSDT